MAKRPIEDKQRRKAARLIRKNQGALPRLFDPVKWVIRKGHAPNKREARLLIENCRLIADDQPVGLELVIEHVGGEVRLAAAASDRARVELRDKLEVITYEEAEKRFLTKEEDEEDA